MVCETAQSSSVHCAVAFQEFRLIAHEPNGVFVKGFGMSG